MQIRFEGVSEPGGEDWPWRGLVHDPSGMRNGRRGHASLPLYDETVGTRASLIEDVVVMRCGLAHHRITTVRSASAFESVRRTAHRCVQILNSLPKQLALTAPTQPVILP